MAVKLGLKQKHKPNGEGLTLGYDKITLLFNAGPLPAGGDCLIVIADGEKTIINSNDLIHDIGEYDILEP